MFKNYIKLGFLGVAFFAFLSINAQNNSPIFTSNPVTSVTVGDIYSYTIITSDADGDTVTVTATSTLPSWLTLSTSLNVSTFAGSTQGLIDGTGTSAQFFGPSGIAFDSAGNIFVADRFNNVIRKITSAGVVSTFVGSVVGAFGHIDATGTAARFNIPNGLAIDSNDNIYVADEDNHCIRKITPAGVVTTLAGSTSGLFGNADGTGSAARFNFPTGVATDAAGNVYVADKDNNLIRKITSAGVVTTIAGSGAASFADGAGTAAIFNHPTGLVLDASGNIYVADQFNDRIRKITSGVVTTIAGSGITGLVNGTGTATQFNGPTGVDLDASGNLYVADNFNNVIRKITPGGVVSTFAGSGTQGYIDGLTASSQFKLPSDVAIDNSGEVYVADRSNHLIRKISNTTKLSGDSTNHLGTTDVTLQANDGNGGTKDQSFTITVSSINPTISSLSPLNNATGIAASSDLILTFNKNVQKGNGNIFIIDASNDTIVQTIAATSNEVSISNTVVTINPTTDLEIGKTYYIKIDFGTFMDLSVLPNPFAGITDNTTWRFATVAVTNTAPTATNVTFTGTVKIGQQLTGTYTYTDADSDTESGTTHKWYRSDNAAGTNKAAITGATAKTYTLVSADAHKYISFEVTPKDGTAFGSAVESALQAVTNTAPTATNVIVTGIAELDQQLTGTYTYTDADSDTESGTTHKWYRSDNAAGTNKAAITGATAKTYTLVSADVAKYISYEVTPKDGTAFGTAVESALQIVTNTPPTISSFIPTNNATGVNVTSDLTITFSENVQKGTGNILIFDDSSTTPFQTIAVSSSNVSISNAQVTISPSANLEKGKTYYVQIPTTAFKDKATTPNAFAGILDKTTWRFATELQDINLVTTITVDNNTPAEGDTIVYTIAVNNPSSYIATGVSLSGIIPIPTGLVFVSDNGSSTYNSSNGLWTIGSIIAGETKTLKVTAEVGANTAGTTITYTVEVASGDQNDPNTTGDILSVDITANDLTAFITTWQTTAANESITIPTFSDETYNYTVNWGDGTISTGQTGNATHIYTTAGTYTVKIIGTFPRIYFQGVGDRNKIKTIKQWGSIAWTSMNDAFGGCSNLKSTATDTPDLSLVKDMGRMFDEATSFNGDLSKWNVSSVTDMGLMFGSASLFNQDISGWDVSSVIDMISMFVGATAFNQDISGWDVSSVTDMSSMFANAASFNQDISGWDVSSVTDMSFMFSATFFNQDISGWDVSSVTDMSFMFVDTTTFDQDISGWDVSSVTDMSYMFNATLFNQDISGWDVSSVTYMWNMFGGASLFNQDLGAWDVSSVTDMSFMFDSTTSFNQDLSSWDVSSVTLMSSMFTGATAFNQDLGAWDISSVRDMTNMFGGVTLSTDNYDNTLISWSTLSTGENKIPTGITFSGGDSVYCAGEAARAKLRSSNYNWQIDDGGKDTACIDVTPSVLLYTKMLSGSSKVSLTFSEWLSLRTDSGKTTLLISNKSNKGSLSKNEIFNGDITVKNFNTDQVIVSFSVNGPETKIENKLSKNGNKIGVVTIDIGSTFTLPSNTKMYIEIANGVFKDLSENVFPGTSTKEFWSFTTGTIIDFSLYPNPVKDILNIETERTVSQIQIINLLGQIVFQKNIDSKLSNLNVSELKKGAYYVKIITNKTVKVVKIIKQ